MIDTPKFPAERSQSYASIEIEAQRARRAMGFDPEEPVPSMALFERLERLRSGANQEIPTAYRVEALVEGVEAETRYNREERIIEVVLSEPTYEALEKDWPRARFSVGHEIGHVALHHVELMRLSRIPMQTAALLRGRFDNLRPFMDVEWQANALAGAYLAPARALWKLELAGRLNVREIMRRFGLSQPAAAKRLSIYEDKKEVLVR